MLENNNLKGTKVYVNKFAQDYFYNFNLTRNQENDII